MIDFDQLMASNDPQTLGVVGSRAWPDRGFVFETIEKYLDRYPTITKLVSGGQPKGVDGWAAEFAEEHDLPITEHLPAHWYPEGHEKHKPFAKRNYLVRNTLIAEDSDVLLAFCWNGSRGTMDTYRKARNRIGRRAVLFTTPSQEGLHKQTQSRSSR